MPDNTPIDKVLVIRTIMEWMIDDYSMGDIVAQTIKKWGFDEIQANKLLVESIHAWGQNEKENNEQKRLRKIESLKKLKRWMKEIHKGTPAGVNAILAIEKELYKLESLGKQPDAKVVAKGKENKLSVKEDAFCREYVIDGNGTQAYKRAGYAAKTDVIAASEAYKLLRKPKIAKAIDELKAEMIRRSDLTTDMIIDELRDLGSWNIQDFLNPDGSFKNLAEMPLHKTKPISGIEITEKILPDGTRVINTKFKLVDKRAVQVDLGRHTGAFTDKVDLTSKGKSIIPKHKTKVTLKLTW